MPPPPPAPAYRHADQLLTRLAATLSTHPLMPAASGSASEHTVTHSNNISAMSAYVLATRSYLRAHVPADLPPTRAAEAAWAEVERRCAFIDAGVNGNVGEFDALTGQFPGEAQFRDEERELARLLIQGLEELRDE